MSEWVSQEKWREKLQSVWFWKPSRKQGELSQKLTNKLKDTYFTQENFLQGKHTYFHARKGIRSGCSPPLRFCYLSKTGTCWNQMSLDLQTSLPSLHVLSIIWHNKPGAKQAFEENSSRILRVLINRLSIKARSIYAKNIMSVLIQVTITWSWKKN